MLSSPSLWHLRNARVAILRAGIVISALVAALLFARHTLATSFAVYDDEGYMLLSFRNYFAGGHLYSQIATEYGPFNFFAERALFRLLHLPVTCDAGRLVTLICWLLSALLAGFFTYKLSRNLNLAAAAGLAAMVLGKVLANEPGHPQQLILPLLLLACCASIYGGRIGLLLGAIGAALFFTKINVGVFYFAAVAQTLMCTLPAGRLRNFGAGLLSVYAVGGPLILMRQDLLGWAGGFCCLAIICGVSTLTVALLTTPPSPAPTRSVVYVAAGALPAAALIIAESLREGMSFSDLMNGVLWDPLRHPRVFSIPLELSKTALSVALFVCAGIIALAVLRNRGLAQANWVDAVRCLVALCTIVQVTIFRSDCLFLAFLPLGLIPPKGRDWQPSESFPRLFVTSLAAAQFLQAYPVAASQLSIAAAPLLLWAFMCLQDGADGLFNVVRRGKASSVNASLPRESTLGGIVALAFASIMLFIGVQPYPTPASSLVGASSLHLPKDQEDRYESLVRNIRSNCSMLFTMPGLGSLNLWSGVPTPNGQNLPAWVKAFSLERQQQILQILAADPRSCVVYNQAIAFSRGATTRDFAQSTLASYILNSMPMVFEEDGYEIRVNPRRDSPWQKVP